MVVKAIAEAVRNVRNKKDKIAMFDYQVLIHGTELRGVDANEFCEKIKVPATYATEYRKMLNLAALLEENGVIINTDKKNSETLKCK